MHRTGDKVWHVVVKVTKHVNHAVHEKQGVVVAIQQPFVGITKGGMCKKRHDGCAAVPCIEGAQGAVVRVGHPRFVVLASLVDLPLWRGLVGCDQGAQALRTPGAASVSGNNSKACRAPRTLRHRRPASATSQWLVSTGMATTKSESCGASDTARLSGCWRRTAGTQAASSSTSNDERI